MLCHGKPKKQSKDKQSHNVDKILWKCHDIPSSGLRGDKDTIVYPLVTCMFVCIAKSMLCHGKPLKSVRTK